VAAAWDSAGMTTGEVTVPLVLSLGFGLARAGGHGGGYGLLGLASVCPILAALMARMGTTNWSQGLIDRSFVLGDLSGGSTVSDRKVLEPLPPHPEKFDQCDSRGVL